MSEILKFMAENPIQIFLLTYLVLSAVVDVIRVLKGDKSERPLIKTVINKHSNKQ